MSTKKVFEITTNSLEKTVAFGEQLGKALRGGEIIELISDVGGGKTTLVRGMAKGIGSRDQVQSPTFTVQRMYKGKVCDIHHFDFYRLDSPGVISGQLTESLNDIGSSVVIEWGDTVADVLPNNRLKIKIEVLGVNSRKLILSGQGSQYMKIIKKLK